MNLWESQVKLFGSEGALKAKQFNEMLGGNNGSQQNSGRVYMPPEVPMQRLPMSPGQLTEAILAHIAPNKVRKDIAHKVEAQNDQKRKERNINAIMQVLKTGSYTAPHPMQAVVESRMELVKREANKLTRKHSNGK